MSQSPPPVPPPMPSTVPIAYATPAGFPMQQPGMFPSNAWSQGRILICAKMLGHPTILPAHCCIKCDQPADAKPLARNFIWHNPLIYLTLFMGVLLYVIIALCVQQKAQLVVPLCRQHRKRRSTMIAVALLAFFGSIALFIMAGVINQGWPALIGLVFLVASPIIGLIGSRVILPTKIDQAYAWFKGASDAYLAGLPSI